ncbi:hypothetical protein [Uliginosibacterium sp. H1]|uniref:hypothetical protein n=1 Tax=Uliginosibacterium sp. H1 TaxID=3114757 RepID=UPI002E180520|nr:hypothetical protein [Uliginosibacterium sp. H1]
MFDAAVYYKTDKGREEVNSRAYHLTARMRAALILIDGKTSGRELRVMLGPLGEVEQIIQQLIDDGFIESDFDLPSASVIAQTFGSLNVSR